jgi:hypothetical protein
MPFSVLTYFATMAVQNKNLIERMKFVKYFFAARVSTILFLGWIENYSNKTNMALDKSNLHLLL